MILRATVRDKHNGDFVRTVDVLTARDFDKVGAAAASWARQRVKGTQLYSGPVRRELVLALEWVPELTPPTPPTRKASAGRANGAKRRK